MFLFIVFGLFTATKPFWGAIPDKHDLIVKLWDVTLLSCFLVAMFICYVDSRAPMVWNDSSGFFCVCDWSLSIDLFQNRLWFILSRSEWIKPQPFCCWSTCLFYSNSMYFHSISPHSKLRAGSVSNLALRSERKKACHLLSPLRDARGYRDDPSWWRLYYFE